MEVITDAKGLGKAIKNNRNEIKVEIHLGEKVLRIKAIGPVAWGVIAAGAAVTITSLILIPATGGASSLIAAPASLITLLTTKNAYTKSEEAKSIEYMGCMFHSSPKKLAAFKNMKSAADTDVLLPIIGIGVAGGGVGVLTKLRDKYEVVEKTENSITLKRK